MAQSRDSCETFLLYISKKVHFPLTLQHTNPDYSAAYVVIDTDRGLKGFGLTFTLGKGTEIGRT